ncbi:O-methyltransferase [Bacillus sp. FSL K6-3431]|uniref:O-methyltransferase n=1 Tax=Bacillus sp. FSL K6-3431 TaxID=2921500 RepID=UPI0030F7E423
MNDAMKHYLEGLLPVRNQHFKQLEKFAKEHRVPIMEPTGIESMLLMMKMQSPKRILEIGTAIGYSALRMADALPEAKVITLELDEERVEQALTNINNAGMDERIKVITGDALELYDETAAQGPYDAIFIDAAKGQYIKFFEMYSELLTEQGCVYTDNVLFKGLVTEDSITNKRLSGLVNKIKTYNRWLMDHNGFDTVILPVGDGLAVSRKRSGVSNE